MTDRQREVLEHLFDLAHSYYGQEKGTLTISSNQPESDFIQEVFALTGELLDKFDNKEWK